MVSLFRDFISCHGCVCVIHTSGRLNVARHLVAAQKMLKGDGTVSCGEASRETARDVSWVIKRLAFGFLADLEHLNYVVCQVAGSLFPQLLHPN